jgi:arylsulfatase A-like enzyme
MNVVLVILDSLRRDHLGCYGNDWIHTPNLDSFSAQSSTFEMAHPESLPTIPVRRSIHTGIRTFPFRDYRIPKGGHVKFYGWQPIPENQVTLAEILRHSGYRTAFITDVYHQFKPSMNFHRGFDEWRWIRGQEADAYNSNLWLDLDPYTSSSGMCNKGVLRRYLANTSKRQREEDYFAPKVFSEAERWMRENRNAERFFLCIDSFDPHEPWDPPQRYLDLYDPDYEGKEVIAPMYREWDDYLNWEELKHMKALYAAEVTMVDRWFGRFMEAMEELELRKDTLVAVISDHGHQLGEHGPTGKLPRALYPELMDIPLMISDPLGEGTGGRIPGFVYNHDLFPTILSYLGLHGPVEAQGIDLRPLIRGEDPSTRSHATSAFNDFFWARDSEFALIHSSTGGGDRLYDLDRDPEQVNDISGERPDEVERLRALILEDAGGPLPDYAEMIRSAKKDWTM